MAERVGFKLGWGCLVFYPFFYCVGLWQIAGAPTRTRRRLCSRCSCSCSSVDGCSRAERILQKFHFKRDPHAKAFGILDPRPLSGGGKHVLTGGFWGLSRHVNYLGEITMATALALVLGYPFALAPWLYPCLLRRAASSEQRDDDKRCAERYGALWEEYCRRVPYRIIPFLY
jgi:delta14-sterol reductase